MIDLFGGNTEPLSPVQRRRSYRTKDGALKYNPCIQVYGKKEGEKCKTCEHLGVKRMGKNYYKCLLRKITASPATDHRVNWPACGKWEQRKETKE